jgi:hypothetical protein
MGGISMSGLVIPENYGDDENAVNLLIEYFTRRRPPAG